MKNLPNVEAMRAASEVKPTTAADARDKMLAFVMAKGESERDTILYAADKIISMVCGKKYMLDAFALANAELAALHEAGLLESRIVVPG